ncbi:iron-siderophore ABC transporter substrate-binding protein [Marinobacter orientalis]|uniref:ABC transporter substrate-binding protein n=2 Tax=Marinobacter orientalis TaxID=1928859 RepID=A0A7Y0RDF6_9GAMM|nr:ABC transporter substrate-binding protein [Marinobacter orientalis]TGX49440.1 iron-siderophore ABC transporter substrate-binding protein [Marinobacter orientalis]
MFTESSVRAFMALLLTGLLSLPASAGTWQHEHGTITLDKAPERIVALNWAATEALLLLGVTPVGVADRDGYDVWVNQPALPAGVPNIGTRVAPSLEAIAELNPDLIVTSSEMAPASGLLASIAPTYAISVYSEDNRPFEKATEMLITLAEMLGREDRANAILADIEQTLEAQRRRLEESGMTDRPVALVNFLDDRHVRIYAPNGLYQSTLSALGLENAWPRQGNFWGFSVVGLEAIAPYRNSRIVVISPVLPGLAGTLANSPFWTYLPPIARNEVYQVDAVWPFGGVFPVKRLAIMLTDALLEGGSDNVR